MTLENSTYPAQFFHCAIFVPNQNNRLDDFLISPCPIYFVSLQENCNMKKFGKLLLVTYMTILLIAGIALLAAAVFGIYYFVNNI